MGASLSISLEDSDLEDHSDDICKNFGNIVVFGFIRQEIESKHKLLVPKSIKQICLNYCGTLKRTDEITNNKGATVVTVPKSHIEYMGSLTFSHNHKKHHHKQRHIHHKKHEHYNDYHKKHHHIHKHQHHNNSHYVSHRSNHHGFHHHHHTYGHHHSGTSHHHFSGGHHNFGGHHF